MRLADSLLRRRAALTLPDQGLASTVLSSSYATQLGNERVDGGAFLSYAENGYAGNGIVFAVIGARLHLFSEAVPRVLDKSTGRILPDDDRLRLLTEPWPNAGAGELLARMEQDVSLAGNSFTLRKDDRLVRLRPDRVELIVLPDEDGHPTVEGYLYSPNGVIGPDSVVYDMDEVAHYSPVPDPLSAYKGMSWLTPVVRDVNADIATTNLKLAFFENAATPNLLIRYQQKLSSETLTKLRSRFEARHRGADQAFKTAILDEGADLTIVGHSFEQIQLTAVQAAGENRIAAAAGVPGIVVGLKEGLSAATYSNYEQAMRRFADGTLRPLWRSAASALGKFVDLEDGEELILDASSVAALRQGEKDRAETFRISAVTANVLITSGFEPDTVAEAVALGDLSVLKHTGSVPTTLYDPEQTTPTDKPAAKQSPYTQGSSGGDK
jgi:HK97 family phage portal protein